MEVPSAKFPRCNFALPVAFAVGHAAAAAYITQMGEIVNLRRARKAKARTEAETEAASKRFKHGRSKAERTLAKAEQEAAQRKLDGHTRDDTTT